MPSPAVKQSRLPPIEHADRTLELDMNALLNPNRTGNKPDARASARKPIPNHQDTTVILDLTATQIHKMISDSE